MPLWKASVLLLLSVYSANCVLCPVGMENRQITDEQITASALDKSEIRLNAGDPWLPYSANVEVTLNLSGPTIITAIAVQGHDADDTGPIHFEHVSFAGRISDSYTFEDYKNRYNETNFEAYNKTSNGAPLIIHLEPPIEARELSIAASGTPDDSRYSLRIELYTDCLFYFEASELADAQVVSGTRTAAVDNMELRYSSVSFAEIVKDSPPFLRLSDSGVDPITLSTFGAISVPQNAAEVSFAFALGSSNFEQASDAITLVVDISDREERRTVIQGAVNDNADTPKGVHITIPLPVISDLEFSIEFVVNDVGDTQATEYRLYYFYMEAIEADCSQTGTYATNSTCRPCDGITQYQDQPNQSSCRNITEECNFPEEYQTVAPSRSNDRECALPTVCDTETQFMAENATATSDRLCQNLTVCQEGQYIAITANSTRNRECSNCLTYIQCQGDNYFKDQGCNPNGTVNNECLQCGIDNCTKCESSDTDTQTVMCTECSGGLNLVENECADTDCPPGTLEKDGTCQPCDNSCVACSFAVDICVACLNGFYYKGEKWPSGLELPENSSDYTFSSQLGCYSDCRDLGELYGDNTTGNCEDLSPACDFATQFQSQAPGPQQDRICTELTACEQGFYESPAATNTSDRGCQPCPAGTYDNSNATGNITTCEACLWGSLDEDSDPATPCIVCDPGTFVGLQLPRVGLCSDKTCPEGQIDADDNPLTPCTCSHGYHPTNLFCETCPAWSTQSVATAIVDHTVVPCTVADYEWCAGDEYRKAVTCAICPPGTYDASEDESGVASCVACALGSVDDDSDPTTECVVCGPGHYLNASMSKVGPCSQFLCPEGLADTDNNSLTQCTCPQGDYIPDGAPNDQTCTTCMAGTYDASSLPGDISSCQPCEIGSVDHDQDPATPCVVCGPGHYFESGEAHQRDKACASYLCGIDTTDHDSNSTTPCQHCGAGKVAPLSRIGACLEGSTSGGARTTASWWLSLLMVLLALQ